jgi:Transposase DDE domain
MNRVAKIRDVEENPFSTDAIVKRLLQAGLEPLDALFTQFEQWVPTPPSACDLAPFASHIVALDETTLDAVTRHLAWQRQHPKGSTALLAGKLAGLFDIRQQRWLRLEYFASAVQNCKVGFLTLLDDLPWHSLLLFDLGYFSFPCFDYLTERGYWWISRLREKTGYQLLHVHYRHHAHPRCPGLARLRPWLPCRLRRAPGALS